MHFPKQSALRNRFLSRLSTDDFARLAYLLEEVELPRGKTISEPYQPIDQLLFPETGVILIMVELIASQTVEAGMIGSEGFITPAILLDTDRVPYRIEVQIPCYGYHIDVARFLDIVKQSFSLNAVCLRYAQCLAVQTSFTATSNALHSVNKRLARWLLMCHDRLDSDDLPLTHKLLAEMLAVRRASITVALQALESLGLVETDRGFVVIMQRTALERFAGDAYGWPEAEYERLLGSVQTKSGLITN